MKKLYEEWKRTAKQVDVEKFSVSISELISWYTAKRPRLIINPVYQRFYRWENEQKSELIESILLGFPIPPLFLYKSQEEGRFEVLDGLQRLATIFEFTGNLRKEEIIPKYDLSKLTRTPFLEELKGKEWYDFEIQGLDFTFLSRSLDFIVLDSNKNDKSIKYKLFRRLNKSSTVLEPQEIRNATIAEIDTELYKKIIDAFSNQIKLDFLSETEKSYRKDIELFIMFLLIKKYLEDENMVNSIKYKSTNFRELLDYYTDTLIGNKEYIEIGLKEFEIFMEMTKDFGFKRYDEKAQKFKGLFVNAFFEIASTIFFIKRSLLLNEKFLKQEFSMSYAEWQIKIKKNNPPAIVRIFESINYAKEILKYEEQEN
ncbi:DUF262 domain-containing protein [Fusobacterium ulcerans]|uniref:DUF262 domain-containing protein n=1 Tax=Fusobacterium ulcerans TaxID=861 RepID=UPI001032B3FC|nr:DUF262 domain-containing protein [Fusobacterium ulcerans]